MCKTAKSKPSKSTEYSRFMSLPYSFIPSGEVLVHIRSNSGKPKDRETVMCQNCGSVIIIGGERLALYRKNGSAYCDRHCAGQDRSRIFRNSPEVFDRHCETRGTNRRYPHTKVAANKCSQCSNPFVSSNLRTVVCSDECRLKRKRAKGRLKGFVAYRGKQSPIETKCRRCDVAFTALTRTSAPHHYCSAVCRRAVGRRKAKHTKRERNKLPAWAVRGDVSLSSLHARSKGRCVQCKCKTVICKTHRPDQATADHIVPMSKGGLHTQDNLQLMCHKCNSAKSNTIDGDAQMVMF